MITYTIIVKNLPRWTNSWTVHIGWLPYTLQFVKWAAFGEDMVLSNMSDEEVLYFNIGAHPQETDVVHLPNWLTEGFLFEDGGTYIANYAEMKIESEASYNLKRWLPAVLSLGAIGVVAIVIKRKK